MARKKKVHPNVTIVSIADKGKAVGKDAEGRVYFVEGVVPGDVVDVLVLRKKKSFYTGIVANFIEKSSHRVEAKCPHFGVCGGCKWQSLDYNEQTAEKEQIVKDALRRIAKVDDSLVKPIMAAPEQYYYRNKLEYSFSSKRWLTAEEIKSDEFIESEPALGFHRPGAFDKIVDIFECHLQATNSDLIRNFIRDFALEREYSFYDVRNHKGLLRNIVIRNTVANDWMVTMIFGKDDQEKIQTLCQALLAEFPFIKTMFYVVNQKVNDTILDQKMNLIHGPGYIIEQLGNVKYKIGPKSFFQTNTEQAGHLYQSALEIADLKPTDNVFDLYCGIGSIGLFMAAHCEQVVGIELIEEAIVDANENTKLNDIKNTKWHAGDVKDILDEGFVNTYGKPDVIITDPPRAGMHKDVVMTLLEIACPKIVYISCNPATQARDIELLKEKYDAVDFQPVDMFPHTSHIENIALLKLR